MALQKMKLPSDHRELDPNPGQKESSSSDDDAKETSENDESHEKESSDENEDVEEGTGNDSEHDKKKSCVNDEEETFVPIKQLLHCYTQGMKALRVQHSRVDDVGEHVIELSKLKKELALTIKTYISNQQLQQTHYQELLSAYNRLKNERTQLENELQTLVHKINTIVIEENETNKQKCDAGDTLNNSLKEKEMFEALLKECKGLVAGYTGFDAEVDKRNLELQSHFEEQWIQHEQVWTQWDVDGIICWIEYLVLSQKIKLSQDTDLQKVAHEMRTQRFCGKSLAKIEKNDLKLFGICIFEDYHQIYHMIRKLVETYPDVDERSGSGEEGSGGGHVQVTGKGVTIPKEYLCSISNKIMLDPVIFEGMNFDRRYLTQYLTEHKTLPGSNEPYDEDETMLKNRKLKQKIDAFLEVHPELRIH